MTGETNATTRRGFLGSLLAVTTAIASGVKLPSGKQLATAPRPAVAIQNDLLALLDECVPVSINATMAMDAEPTYEIEYLHVGTGKAAADPLGVGDYTRGMRPVGVWFRATPSGRNTVTVQWA